MGRIRAYNYGTFQKLTVLTEASESWGLICWGPSLALNVPCIPTSAIQVSTHCAEPPLLPALPRLCGSSKPFAQLQTSRENHASTFRTLGNMLMYGVCIVGSLHL